MSKQKNLIDRINEVRSNSVTAEEYKAFWGEDLDKHVDELMDFADEFDAQMEESVEVNK